MIYNKKLIKTLTIAGVFFILFSLITSKINIAFNQSPSLSGRVFLIVKGTLPKEKHDRVIFKDKEEIADIQEHGSRYPVAHKSSVKEVIGFESDVVLIKKRDGVNHIYINNQDYGVIKEYSLKGERLYPITNEGKSIVIPQDYYFVHTPHKDSYDSRYDSVGLIHKSQIIGRAYEIL
jgi:conjugal transfer pilin signal peptidase TrbI